MKALRYLLMVMIVALVSVTVHAQFTASFKNSQNQPVFNQQAKTEYAFYTTSILMESGSNLPIAARNGFTVGADSPDDNLPSGRVGGRNPRRAIGDGDDDIPVPGDNEDPNATPVGDGMWVLLLLAAGFAFGKWCYQMMLRRRKATA